MLLTAPNPQDTQDIQTPCPVVPEKPECIEGRHPALVQYRLFSQGALRSKVFGQTKEGRDAMAAFITSLGAKAELINGTWSITDKGQVDYMVVGFVDAELHAQREAKRLLAKQMIANWRASL